MSIFSIFCACLITKQFLKTLFLCMLNLFCILLLLLLLFMQTNIIEQQHIELMPGRESFLFFGCRGYSMPSEPGHTYPKEKCLKLSFLIFKRSSDIRIRIYYNFTTQLTAHEQRLRKALISLLQLLEDAISSTLQLPFVQPVTSLPIMYFVRGIISLSNGPVLILEYGSETGPRLLSYRSLPTDLLIHAFTVFA